MHGHEVARINIFEHQEQIFFASFVDVVAARILPLS
jgi:hypothetical protein